MSDDSYWSRMTGRRVSRRALVRGGGVAGAGLLGAALIGCGSSNGSATATTPAGGGGGGLKTATAAPTGSAETVKRGGTYNAYVTGDPPTLDPNGNTSYSTKGFAAYVYSRMYRINAQPGKNPFDQDPVGDLAQSAESSDGQHWTVKLKPGIKFQNIDPLNGRALTSDDVLESWKKLTDPKSTSANLVTHFTKVEAVDDTTYTFALDAPSPTFLETLADANIFWVLPKESGDSLDIKLKPVGTGPWIMDQYVASSKMTFKANKDYYDKGVPYLDGVTLSNIPETAQQQTQFEAGNLHVLSTPVDAVLDLRSRHPDLIWNAPLNYILNWVNFSGADMDPNGAWRDERFRQGVSMAVDRDGMNQLIFNPPEMKKAGIAINTDWNNFIPAGFGSRFWLDPKSADQGASAKYFKYDVAEAKKLLDAVGIPSQTITYQYTNRYGKLFDSLGEAIGNWLTGVGLKTTTDVQDYSSKYITQTFRGNFHGIAFMSSTVFSEAGSYVNRFFGDDPNNHGRVHDDAITALDKKQQVEMDKQARTKILFDIQRANAEKMYYAPVQAGTGTSFTAYQPSVQNVAQTRGYGGAAELLPFYWLKS